MSLAGYLPEAFLLVGNAAQRAVKQIGPTMVGAHNRAAGVASPFEHGAAPMPADVVKGSQFSYGIAHHKKRMVHEL